MDQYAVWGSDEKICTCMYMYMYMYCIDGHCKHTCTVHIQLYMYAHMYCTYTCMYIYMKIHVPSMLAIGVHTTNKQAATMASLKLEQPLWLRKIKNNNQPPWLRK